MDDKPNSPLITVSATDKVLKSIPSIAITENTHMNVFFPIANTFCLQHVPFFYSMSIIRSFFIRWEV